MPGFYDKSCYSKNERNYWKQQSISYITANDYQEWNTEKKLYTLHLKWVKMISSNYVL